MNRATKTIVSTISRRRFLRIGCLSTAAVGLTLCGITATTPEPPPVVLSSAAFGDKQMNHRVLIAYATYAGSTQEVAVEIGKVLGERGFAVDVIPAVENPQVDDYDYVLIGSAVHGSRWLSEALEFVESNQTALNRAPVALFSVCLSGLAKDEAQLASARDTVYGPVRAFVTPVAETLFAGKVDRRGVGASPVACALLSHAGLSQLGQDSRLGADRFCFRDRKIKKRNPHCHLRPGIYAGRLPRTA